MKWVCGILCIIIIGTTLGICGLKKDNVEEKQDYLRIHIRANSNSEIDQSIKYKVRDKIVESLIPVLSECETKNQAKVAIENNFELIENTANNVLDDNNMNYKSSASIKNEYFPTRIYDEITLEAGDYDALIVDLGSGEGDNWWCIVYPAFCFVKSKNSTNNKYISLIWEIINNR